MSRKYQHTMELLPQIQEMLASGITQKQVEDALGLTGYRPICHGNTNVQMLTLVSSRSPLFSFLSYRRFDVSYTESICNIKLPLGFPGCLSPVLPPEQELLADRSVSFFKNL